jgi:hypothetical protein
MFDEEDSEFRDMGGYVGVCVDHSGRTAEFLADVDWPDAHGHNDGRGLGCHGCSGIDLDFPSSQTDGIHGNLEGVDARGDSR